MADSQRLAAAASDSSLGRCFGRFGNVIAVTLRRKPGLCKSWALVTFETNEAAEAAVAMLRTARQLGKEAWARSPASVAVDLVGWEFARVAEGQ